MALLITAVLICLIVLIEIAARPMQDLYGPIVWLAKYEGAPLERVVRDLEQDQVIPAGTSWKDESLRNLPVTGRWMLAPPREVLHDVAVSAGVRIEYPVGYHGDMLGPAEIVPSVRSEAGVFPRMDRRLELRQKQEPVVAAPN